MYNERRRFLYKLTGSTLMLKCPADWTQQSNAQTQRGNENMGQSGKTKMFLYAAEVNSNKLSS